MSKVEKSTVKKLVEVEEEGFLLSLTREEALILAVVFAKVGGNPSETARGTTQEILDNLNELGVYYSDSEHYRRASGEIEFS